MKPDSIPAAMLERIEDELLVDERLLWAGNPLGGKAPLDAGRQATRAAVKAVVMGMLVAVGMIVFLSESAVFAGPPRLLMMGMVALTILMLLVLMARRQFTQAKAIYAITDRRVLILSGRSVQSYGARDIDFIERRMHRDGTGDILFRREALYADLGSPRERSVPVGLFNVENPRTVEALMLEVFRPGESGAAMEKPKRGDALDDEALNGEADAAAPGRLTL